MNIELVLYDLDGTLGDTWPLIVASFEHLGKKFGFSVDMTHPCMKSCTLKEAYARLAPHLPFEMLYKEHVQFQDEHIHLTHVFEHAPRVVKKTGQHFKNAVLTNSMGNGHLFLKQWGLYDYMHRVIGAEHVQKPKPDPEGILLLLDEFKIDRTKAIIVGDTGSDIAAGKAAGIWTVGVDTNGCSSELVAAKPDFLIKDLSGLLDIVF